MAKPGETQNTGNTGVATNDTNEMGDIFRAMGGDDDQNVVVDENYIGGEQVDEANAGGEDNNQRQQAATEGDQSQQTQQPVADHTQHQLRQLTQTYIPSLERENQRLTERVQTLEAVDQGVRQYVSDIQSHGLSPDEARIGLRLASQFKTNPATCIANLIAHARASGIQLGQDTPNMAPDAGAVASLVEQRVSAALAPIMQFIQPQLQAYQHDTQLANRVSQFFNTYPEAVLHENDIARIVSANPSMSPERAWMTLYQFAVKEGYDLSQPLAPQHQAKQSNNNNTNINTKQPPMQMRRSGPTTANPNPNNNANGQPKDWTKASWRDLVNSAVAEAQGNA